MTPYGESLMEGRAVSRKKGRQRRPYAPPRDDATCRVVITPGAFLVSWQAAPALWEALHASFTLEMGGHAGVQADAAGRVWQVPGVLEGPLRDWLAAHFAGGQV